MSADADIPDEAQVKGRTQSLARRFLDSYTLVFFGILATLLILSTIGERPAGRALGIVLLSGVFLLAVAASSTKSSTMGLAVAVVVPVTVAAIVASALGSNVVARSATVVISVLLVVGSPVVIARRIAKHRAISASTVMGALCIYLFIGLFFAFSYSGLDLLTNKDFFVQLSDPTLVDYVYFSYTTLTTLGYGDLTPALGLARMEAIIEAIAGQLYLVTIVAVVVGHIGSRRHLRQ